MNHPEETVHGEQTRYRDHREADERAAVLVANSLPEQQLRQLDIVYMSVKACRCSKAALSKGRRAEQAGTPLGLMPAQNRRELCRNC